MTKYDLYKKYVHAKKHEDRNVMKALAQIDGFISN